MKSRNLTISKLILKYLPFLCPSPVLGGTNPGLGTRCSRAVRKPCGIFTSRILSALRLLLLSLMPSPQSPSLSLLPSFWSLLELLLSSGWSCFPSPPQFVSRESLLFPPHLLPRYRLGIYFSPSLLPFSSSLSLIFPTFRPAGSGFRRYSLPSFLNLPFNLPLIFSV